MGGHGGLNILPQKSWNVYNYENREKVRRDEEAAAKEEQLKREQSRKRDAELRLVQLRQARGVATQGQSDSSEQVVDDSKHINLFEGLPNFLPLEGNKGEKETKNEAPRKKLRKEEAAAPKVILPEDEKYRLGYGVAGKGVKAPWYLARPSVAGSDEEDEEKDSDGSERLERGKKTGKKSLEELREERMKREKREKEREKEVMLSSRKRDRDVRGKDGKVSRRWS